MITVLLVVLSPEKATLPLFMGVSGVDLATDFCGFFGVTLGFLLSALIGLTVFDGVCFLVDLMTLIGVLAFFV